MNGTGAYNQATDTAQSLKALGFNIGTESATPTPVGQDAETVVYYSSKTPSELAAAQAVANSMTGAVIMADDPSQVKPGSQVTVVTGTEFTVNAPPVADDHGHVDRGFGTPHDDRGGVEQHGIDGVRDRRVEQRRLPAADLDGLAAGTVGPAVVHAERGRGDLSRSPLVTGWGEPGCRPNFGVAERCAVRYTGLAAATSTMYSGRICLFFHQVHELQPKKSSFTWKKSTDFWSLGPQTFEKTPACSPHIRNAIWQRISKLGRRLRRRSRPRWCRAPGRSWQRTGLTPGRRWRRRRRRHVGMRPSGTRALSSSMISCAGTPRPRRGHLDVHVDRGAGHPAGHDRVDPDVRRAELVSQDPGRREERTLRNGVAALGRLRLAGHHRRHVHHRAPAALAEEREARPSSSASEPKRLTSMILRQMERSTSSKLWKTSLAEGVVHHDVDPAELLGRRRHQRRTGVGVDDVGRHGGAPGAEAGHLGQHLVEPGLLARRQHDVRPVRRQRQRRLSPQAGADPGHHTHFAGEQAGCTLPTIGLVLRCHMGRSVSSGPVSPPAIRAVVTGAWKDRDRVESREGQWRSVGTAGARCPRASAV